MTEDEGQKVIDLEKGNKYNVYKIVKIDTVFILRLLKVISPVCGCLLIKVLIVQCEQCKHFTVARKSRPDRMDDRREGSERGPEMK